MYVITANVKNKVSVLVNMTNDKSYHMILVIIIVMRGENMLQRTLGSGWGVLLPGAVIAALGFADLSLDAWRGLVTLGLLMSAVMIWHRQLRHFVLLPSCVALVSGIMLMTLNLRLMG
ncbi:Protein of uncharacterised function (DUF1435) [Raoultella terrigena]|jgi:hypothetical protein|uniref:Protein of uncharacterized function (DUF1435) n=1 Tax=Raoultella terrigena TaxID=577 RepID=A0A6D1SBE9_RAOTE|nr:Protein of uncharacterised function (DUF1435) [Raoultella terrigena]VFS65570.1 Protein of uncharacterised function (DUF1435) [Raoultella terrigena]VTM23883.1 Protein of uncharacterised function (DUF1435) [Raoultella terrigena]VUC89100.1 tryptophan-specific transport protein [Raoultella terrigena]